MERWGKLMCWAAVTVCVCLLLLDGRALVKAQFGVEARAEAVMRGELTATRADLLGEVRAARVEVTQLARETASRTDAQATAARGDALRAIAMTLARVDRVATVLEAVQTSAQPVLDGAARVVAEAERDLRDARPAVEAAVKPQEV